MFAFRNKLIALVAGLIVFFGALGVFYLQDNIRETRHKLSAEPRALVIDIQNTQRHVTYLLLKMNIHIQTGKLPPKREIQTDLQRLIRRWGHMSKALEASSIGAENKETLVKEGQYFLELLLQFQNRLRELDEIEGEEKQKLEELMNTLDDQAIYISTKTSELVFQLGVKQADFLSLLGVFLTVMIIAISIIAVLAAALLVKVFGQKEKLDLLVRQDSLTSLGNRRAFDEHFAITLARSRRFDAPFTMLLLDLDNFKKYNDTYGHLQGDKALKLIADVLKSRMNRAEDLAFRLGGEEFTCLFSAVSAKAAERLANDILQGVRDLKIEHVGNPPENCLTISGGLIHFKELGTLTPDDMYRLVDKALYQSKERGRNQLTVYKFGDNEVVPHATLK